jgi:type IV pilus assembly protein PilM
MSYLEKFYQLTEPIIGVDIGYQSLKVVQLNRKAYPAKLIAFGSASIPVKGMTSSNADHSEEIAKIILKCMNEARPKKIRGKYVVSGLPESRVFTKIIDVPIMSPKEMEMAIPHEASRHIPLPIDEIYLDYQPLNLKNNQMESVLFVAAPKKLVEKYLKVLRSANLEPIALETKPIAAGRSLITPSETQPTLILDIGAEATGISVFDQNTLKFTYTIPHGGYTFSKAIANFLNVDFERAEKIKRTCGLSPKCQYGNLASALQPIFTDILEEMTNAIKFYEHRSQPSRKITNIRLCGGGANTKGLADYLYQRLENKIKVVIGNPLINLNQRSTRKLPPAEILHFTTAIGLALREKY